MWLLLVVVYFAPPDAIDWKGSWELGLSRVMEERYETEAGCLAGGQALQDHLGEGMLAPVRIHCVRVEKSLPPHPSKG